MEKYQFLLQICNINSDDVTALGTDVTLIQPENKARRKRQKKSGNGKEENDRLHGLTVR